MLNSSFNSKYPTSLWITFLTEKDGTTHSCHRSNYLDMMEYFEINSIVIENSEKDYNYKFYDYHIWERFTKYENRTFWIDHPNFKRTLDKYCVKEQINY